MDSIKQQLKDLRFLWPSLAALAIILLAVLLEFNWVWGVLFLFWTVSSMVIGKAYIVQEVDRKRAPVLFWTINVVWLGLSIFAILSDILD